MSLRSKIQDMMVRERSRGVSKKKELMPDTTYLPPPIPASTTSLRLLLGYSAKRSMEYSDQAAALCPRSMKLSSPIEYHLFSSTSCKTKSTTAAATTGTERKHHPWDKGLGLVEALSNKEGSDIGLGRMVIFRSQLKIQTLAGLSNSSSPQSPIELGSKTKNSMSPSQIKLSEDYTCVISHGPNPKKTHIFDNCIIESFE